jgi:hypothetical protein
MNKNLEVTFWAIKLGPKKEKNNVFGMEIYSDGSCCAEEMIHTSESK